METPTFLNSKTKFQKFNTQHENLPNNYNSCNNNKLFFLALVRKRKSFLASKKQKKTNQAFMLG